MNFVEPILLVPWLHEVLAKVKNASGRIGIFLVYSRRGSFLGYSCTHYCTHLNTSSFCKFFRVFVQWGGGLFLGYYHRVPAYFSVLPPPPQVVIYERSLTGFLKIMMVNVNKRFSEPMYTCILINNKLLYNRTY